MKFLIFVYTTKKHPTCIIKHLDEEGNLGSFMKNQLLTDCFLGAELRTVLCETCEKQRVYQNKKFNSFIHHDIAY